MVSKSKRMLLWAIWLIIWPLSIIWTYTSWPIYYEDQLLSVMSFAIIMATVSFFPIIVNKTPIFLVNCIGFAVFLIFGLFVEVLLTQIALVVVLIKLKIDKSQAFRVPLNLLMFLFISILSASVYKWIGGLHETIVLDSFTQQLQLIGYVVTVFLSNQIFLHFVKRFFYVQETKFFDEGFMWEMITTSIVLPIGFILYLMYENFGVIGIYVVGIPFISISIIMKLFYSSRNVNYYLKQTNEIGQALTGKLERNDVITVFLTHITEIFAVDYAMVYDVVDQKSLKLIRSYTKSEGLVYPDSISIGEGNLIIQQAWRQQEMLHYKHKKEWDYLRDSAIPEDGESIVVMPVKRNNEIVAIIVFVSKDKQAFTEHLFTILNILNNFLGIALENAKNYEGKKIQSETDQLTGLYNFRYFEAYMQNYRTQTKEFNKSKIASLILFDLDHFKKINDTYGHECGNEVLIAVAERVNEFIGDRGLVARYGGEEFVVFLPGMNAAESQQIAEELRQIIENKTITTDTLIQEDEEFVDVTVTISVGVASYPEHCEDPFELIRLADRAMYVGAKQKGRNRVAVYQS